MMSPRVEAAVCDLRQCFWPYPSSHMARKPRSREQSPMPPAAVLPGVTVNARTRSNRQSVFLGYRCPRQLSDPRPHRHLSDHS